MEPKKKKKRDDIIDDKAMKKTFNHVVDYIIGKRVGPSGRSEYLVKWEGWPVRDATWEPESNFASAQVAQIFETGLRQQMGIPEQSVSAKKKRQTDKAFVGKSRFKRKNKDSTETMASKMFDQLRMKHQKKGRPPKVQKRVISTKSWFDVDLKIQNVINSHEKVVGASKRKSSRMSCPSLPFKSPKSNRSKSPSLRALRYQMRENTKTSPLNIDGSASYGSNTSLEENKNPFDCDPNQSGHMSDRIKTPKNRKREIKVNYDSNKMASRDTDNQFEEKADEEITPSKRFLNKVRQRFSDKPILYDDFLTSVIEYHTRNVELNNMLANNDELIDSFFSILHINRDHLLDPDMSPNRSTPATLLSEEDIDGIIKQWLDRLSTTLTIDQQSRFWNYIKEKDKKEVVRASPDFFWLEVNTMFRNHKDLKEEFKAFMPNFCRSIHEKYWNSDSQ